MVRRMLFLLLFIVIILFTSCSILNQINNTKPLKVGNITVMQIPKNAVVEYTNEKYADKIRRLKNKNTLLIFTGYSTKDSISKKIAYAEARINAQKNLMKYLNSKKEIISVRAEKYLKNNMDNTENSKNINSIILKTKDLVVKVLSNTNVFSGKEIARYYVPEDEGIKYYSVIIYDPELLENTLNNTFLFLEKLGIKTKELIKEINEEIVNE